MPALPLPSRLPGGSGSAAPARLRERHGSSSRSVRCSQVLEVPLSEKLLPVVQAVLGRQVRDPLSPRFLCQLQQLWSKDHLSRRCCPSSSLIFWS